MFLKGKKIEKNLTTILIYDFFLAISESKYLFSIFLIEKLSIPQTKKIDDILYFAL